MEKRRLSEEQPTMTSPGYRDKQWPQLPKGCPSCRAAGRGELCDHWHVCGSSDHWTRGCRKKNGSSEKTGPGNRWGLKPRDRK